MNRILILTKNISVESHLQEQLQKLNYEVLVSVSMWENWAISRSTDPFLKSFQWIFLSETIADSEAKEFGEQFSTDCLIRVVGDEPSEAASEEWCQCHISDWIVAHTSLERLREKLVYKDLLQKVEFNADPSSAGYKKAAFPLYFSDIHFTKLEKEIIHRLMLAEDLSLAREELCSGWRSKNQNSKLSQLSSSITRIRRKVEKAYGIEDAVHTLWGQGYQLNEYFHSCLLKGEFRNRSVRIST